MPIKRTKWVLVVDDDDNNHESILDILNDGGYDAKGAAGGEDALALLGVERPFLVLVAFFMRDMEQLGSLAR